MTTTPAERCCARCLFHHPFPWYVNHSFEGFCRRPEVYESRTREEQRDNPLFIMSAQHQCCPRFRDAAEFYASAGLGPTTAHES